VKIDIETTLPISKVNQNFSEAARMTEDKGVITIMKNNKPKFVMMTFEKFKQYEKKRIKNIYFKNIIQG
jgi:antitoxin Phd